MRTLINLKAQMADLVTFTASEGRSDVGNLGRIFSCKISEQLTICAGCRKNHERYKKHVSLVNVLPNGSGIWKHIY